MTLPIYLDNASSTSCDPEVLKNIIPYFSIKYANPANTYNPLGKEVYLAVERSRKKVANLFNCLPKNIVWTSGATESNNIAIQGVIKRIRAKNPDYKTHCITSTIEHKSVLEIFKSFKDIEVTFVKPNSEGITNIKDITNCIRANTRLVSIMMANNELGVINDVNGLGEFCSSRGIILHTDATQIVGKTAIDLNTIKVDLLSFSGHKIYATKGIGGLFVRDFSKLSPVYHGGGHETRLRPGTLNVPAIIGLGVACELFKENQSVEYSKLAFLRDKFEKEIAELDERIIINGLGFNRLPNISNISFPIRKGKQIFDEIKSIVCSSGSACDSFDNNPSHVLMEIGKNSHEAKNTVRFSFGRYNTMEEVNLSIDHIKTVLQKILS